MTLTQKKGRDWLLEWVEEKRDREVHGKRIWKRRVPVIGQEEVSMYVELPT